MVNRWYMKKINCIVSLKKMINYNDIYADNSSDSLDELPKPTFTRYVKGKPY